MEITWQVDDGYAGGFRPHMTTVNDDDLAKCETVEERESLISDSIQNAFSQVITWAEIRRS